jgi:hypothetical protein
LDPTRVVSVSALHHLTGDSAAIDVPSTGCFAKKGEFVSRTIAGETILVPVRGQIGDLDAIYNLNEVGSFIWERLDGIATVQNIKDAVAAEFEVPAEQAKDDTLQFIRDLKISGIVQQIGPRG